MEINEKDLSKVSGGCGGPRPRRNLVPVETKEGSFILAPEGYEVFDSIDSANKKIEEIKEKKCHCSPHHHHKPPHGPVCSNENK